MPANPSYSIGSKSCLEPDLIPIVTRVEEPHQLAPSRAAPNASSDGVVASQGKSEGLEQAAAARQAPSRSTLFHTPGHSAARSPSRSMRAILASLMSPQPQRPSTPLMHHAGLRHLLHYRDVLMMSAMSHDAIGNLGGPLVAACRGTPQPRGAGAICPHCRHWDPTSRSVKRQEWQFMASNFFQQQPHPVYTRSLPQSPFSEPFPRSLVGHTAVVDSKSLGPTCRCLPGYPVRPVAAYSQNCDVLLDRAESTIRELHGLQHRVSSGKAHYGRHGQVTAPVGWGDELDDLHRLMRFR